MGSLGDLRQKLNNIPKRLKHFVTHDVKRNPILGLYLVIGVMAVGYLIYFVFVIYKDVTTPDEKRLATKPKAAQVKKPPPVKKKPPPPKKPATPKSTPAKP